MPKAQSINQNLHPDALPNFRNMGVTLRSLLLVNGMALLMLLAQASSWTNILPRMTEVSSLLEPVLFTSLLLLFALDRFLARLPYWLGAAAVSLLCGAVTLAIFLLGGELYVPAGESALFEGARSTLLGCVTAVLLLLYFRLRAAALSPALQASRLQALQARIRPHFLFNSINAVLGIVRADPRRAEAALEDMSDLFRMAMAHHGDLVPAREEVELARQYLSLEQLRMGERLKVDWHLEELPADAMFPPLVLQPLLENAVYHGIEPLAEGGVIDVGMYRSGNKIHLKIANPCHEKGEPHEGNKMALGNIQERLELLFDVEAIYTVESGKDFYRVHIMLPYVKEETP